ncbi:MAG: TadE/TadG family type IV pilus assembly protein [Anaerolineae bacterium]
MRQKGQSIVEFAILLPFLILLIIGMVEIAMALRSYLITTTACREGIRFAARGRYTDEDAARWMVSSGGVTSSGQPILRTTGNDANVGVIITHIPILANGTVLSGTVYITGTAYITETRVSEVEVERHRAETIAINNQRTAAGYDALDNQLIIVEVFYAHHTLWNYEPLGLPPILRLYARSVMRVVSDARQAQ